MSITVNKGQQVTKALYNTIMLEAQCALAYLPVEDKVNLAMSLVNAPVIDDEKTVKAMAVELQGKLEEANDLIAQLQQRSATTVKAANTTP